jgi:TonB family protein
MTEDWTKQWERRIVNGVYPLRRFLGRSDHSVVFLTECKAQDVAQAAIKILPANPALIETQLAHWRRLATLSHPHLIRLLDAGRCQLGGHNFLFAVTDYAEQNLAQILRGRRLAPDEVRELLPATLDALAYLHGKNLVQGGLKPANLLAVGDQLKLASDTIRPAGERTASTAKPSLYDPPEAKSGRGSTAGDIWGLGITLVEALTQSPPAWSRESSENVSLPANLAPEFLDTVQRCLSLDPGRRPAIAELVEQFQTAPAAAPPAVPPVINEPWIRTLYTQTSPKARFLITAVTVGIITLWVVWTGIHLYESHAAARQSASITPEAPTAVSPPAVVESPKANITPSLPPVLHQEIPDLSHSTRDSIRGVINVGVRVIVDRSGNVVAATLDDRVSNKHFGRAALDAAKKWKFAPAADQVSRVWLLHFNFTRAGITADAVVAR